MSCSDAVTAPLTDGGMESRSYTELQQLNTSTQELSDNVRTRKRKHNAEEETLELEGSLNNIRKRKRKRATKNKGTNTYFKFFFKAR
jgi:hypothetical protein